MIDKIENIRSVLADAQFHDLPGAATAMLNLESISAAMLELKNINDEAIKEFRDAICGPNG